MTQIMTYLDHLKLRETYNNVNIYFILWYGNIIYDKRDDCCQYSGVGRHCSVHISISKK